MLKLIPADIENKKENTMHTLADLKGSEVKLRESLRKERIPEFKADIKYAYRLVKTRRLTTERRIGIGE